MSHRGSIYIFDSQYFIGYFVEKNFRTCRLLSPSVFYFSADEIDF